MNHRHKKKHLHLDNYSHQNSHEHKYTLKKNHSHQNNSHEHNHTHQKKPSHLVNAHNQEKKKGSNFDSTRECYRMLRQLIYKKKLTIKDLPKSLPFKNTQDLLDFNNVSEDEYQEVVRP
ncbi:probable serine/threonine-protein kinase fhkB isoform X3 [Nasonia vitripennis]|uniref:Uncharacterized protein n=1 Tax=Nasonia vitripennis TaxID=7425 RepID=A0A7M7IV88_NASVI|nr:probable serine/threonine-protein kinase fhkB isoform X3 [Nasonia vitripennis]